MYTIIQIIPTLHNIIILSRRIFYFSAQSVAFRAVTRVNRTVTPGAGGGTGGKLI